MTGDGSRSASMLEVRRDGDDEPLGFVAADGEGWLALTVFHGVLAAEATRAEAVETVHRRGLASLAERWWWFSLESGEWHAVLPQESSPGRVRVVVGWYSLPGVPTATITAADLDAGDRLVLRPPEGVAEELLG